MRRLSATVWTAITAAIALASALLALLFQLLPELKPDPRESVGAEVEIYGIEPRTALGTWVNRAFAGDERERQRARIFTADGNSPAFEGEAVYVRVTVDGFKHKTVFLRARLYDAETQTPAQIQSLGPGEGRNLKLDAPNRRSVQLLWIPSLEQEARPVFLRVELYDEKGILAVDDSPVLDHGRMKTAG
jgi:hypothetical protein